MSRVLHHREVTAHGVRRHIYVGQTWKGYVVEVYRNIGKGSSLERRRYLYGPDAYERARADMMSYFDEVEP